MTEAHATLGSSGAGFLPSQSMLQFARATTILPAGGAAVVSVPDNPVPAMAPASNWTTFQASNPSTPYVQSGYPSQDAPVIENPGGSALMVSLWTAGAAAAVAAA